MLFNRSLQELFSQISGKLHMSLICLKKGIHFCPEGIVQSPYCHVSKILEKIIYKHIYNHLHINKLLYKFQSGFPPGYSTTYLLIELYDDILLALDKKKNKLQMTLLLAIPHIMKNKYRYIIFKCMVM